MPVVAQGDPSKREYTEGTDTISIALVINGQEIWIGNEDVRARPRGVRSTRASSRT